MIKRLHDMFVALEFFKIHNYELVIINSTKMHFINPDPSLDHVDFMSLEVDLKKKDFDRLLKEIGKEKEVHDIKDVIQALKRIIIGEKTQSLRMERGVCVG